MLVFGYGLVSCMCECITESFPDSMTKHIFVCECVWEREHDVEWAGVRSAPLWQQRLILIQLEQVGWGKFVFRGHNSLQVSMLGKHTARPKWLLVWSFHKFYSPPKWAMGKPGGTTKEVWVVPPGFPSGSNHYQRIIWQWLLLQTHLIN